MKTHVSIHCSDGKVHNYYGDGSINLYVQETIANFLLREKKSIQHVKKKTFERDETDYEDTYKHPL